jgi:phosphoribosylformimino-5-aminoimidazole carboxamide ribonucleotide (ProFAR) isomerase
VAENCEFIHKPPATSTRACKAYAAPLVVHPFQTPEPMQIIPSLTLNTDSSRAYAFGCAETIQSWERAGFGRVQLTLGRGSAPPDVGLRVAEEALREAHCAVQLRGALESTEDIDSAMASGAAFVVLSGRALDELDWLAGVAARFPGALLLACPARERRARTRGAIRTHPLDLRDLAAEVAALPLAGMVVDFATDDVIAHAELALLEDVAEELPFSVQCSGAAPSLTTLRDLEFRGVAATIIAAAHLSAEFDEQTLARSFPD